MAKIDVGGAIGAGFGLIRRRPLAILAWGLLPMLLQLATFAILAPFLLQTLSETARVAAGGAAAGPPSIAQSLQLQALSQVTNLVGILISSVVYCAAWRAVLQPEKRAFAYLRLGAPELFLAILTFGAGMAFGFALVLTMIPAAIIGAIAGGASHSAIAGFAVGIPIVVAVMLIGGFYVFLRFAFVGPMMVADGKFRFLESWNATRGHVGSLFLVGFGIFGLFLLFEVVLMTLLVGLGFAVVNANGGLDQFLQAFKQSPADALAKLWPLAAAGAVLLVPLAGCITAIGAAPWARAYQDVASDHAATSETFA